MRPVPAFIATCALLGSSMAPAHSGPSKTLATGALQDGSGAHHGTVALSGTDGRLHMSVKASGLTRGMHGLHIHAVGACTAPDFTSAGGHWNPDNKQHGHANPMGAHRGDLPQLDVAADGTGKAEFDIASSLSELLDADGAALIVHAAADDEKTDPTGNSGARLLCAVLTPAG